MDIGLCIIALTLAAAVLPFARACDRLQSEYEAGSKVADRAMELAQQTRMTRR
jgi:hypothetical protein